MSGEIIDTDGGHTDRRSARAARACAACRARKQRCLLTSGDAQAPCQRCVKLNVLCSFVTVPLDSHKDIGPSSLARMVVELQQRVNSHETRLAELEGQDSPKRKRPRLPDIGNANLIGLHTAGDSRPRQLTPINLDTTSTPVQKPAFSFSRLELSAPIATLRSLGALEDEQGTNDSSGYHIVHRNAPCDPVTRGILSAEDAQRAFEIFFEHCHPWAPVLNESLRQNKVDLRITAPILYLAIVSIGSRFWGQDDFHVGPPIRQGLHPRYFELIAVLDDAMSCLAVRPTPADASLDNLTAIMLYLQWMPCNSLSDASSFRHQSEITTRYNDMSAWTLFALARTYAGFMGLDRGAVVPFADTSSVWAASTEDLDRMRVWLNIITYDCNLTLTSGLPVSLIWHTATAPAHSFSAHQLSQKPGDLRYAAMTELVSIIQQVRQSKANVVNQDGVIASIKRANAEMDHWERQWLARLERTKLQHTQMPFTSVRWYRLALNSFPLRRFLSPKWNSGAGHAMPAWVLELLEINLTSAAQIVFSVSAPAPAYVWNISSQVARTFPEGPLHVNPEALKSLHHAVDSTWITYTFAITFLVLCFVRGTIDDELRIQNPVHSVTATSAPITARSTSALARLTQLALDVFDTKLSPTKRPQNDFSSIVRNAGSLILSPQLAETESAQASLDSSLQWIHDLMEEPGWDWSWPLGAPEPDWIAA